MKWYVPKIALCLKEGYKRADLLRDTVAGVTVAIIALPLAMAFGIASIPENAVQELAAIHPSLTPPAVGLYTAVIAGFLISALGGSRVQIGGPTGAFIVIIYGIAARHGFAGLATATAMAGGFLIIFGLARFGRMIKFIPYPVTTGFTTGIAVIIAVSQVKDLLGLELVAEGENVTLPAEFIGKVEVLGQYAHTASFWATVVGLGSLAVMLLLRAVSPRIPFSLVAIALASVLVELFELPVETIGSRFGWLPTGLHPPRLPAFDPALMRELLPDALTIALLGAIESLLSAVVADGMTGSRHKSDCELLGQGAANLASAAFWGIPATGAIARTVANIKAGGRTPVAGMVHALSLLAIMMLAAPLARLIPLSSLAAVLLVVAWNMSELDHFRDLLKAPRSDVAVLLTTFALTVLTDLTLAVGVGVVLASLLFMKRMSEVTGIESLTLNDTNNSDRLEELTLTERRLLADLPADIQVYEINGPFFFGCADRLSNVFGNIARTPKFFILRMRNVPAVDATGLYALEDMLKKCERRGTTLLISGIQSQPKEAFIRSGFLKLLGRKNLFSDFDDALLYARRELGIETDTETGSQLKTEVL